MDPSKSMEVCAVCGALLVLADLQLRPKDHIQGKQHVGYARIRAYIDSRRALEAGAAGVTATTRVDRTSSAVRMVHAKGGEFSWGIVSVL